MACVRQTMQLPGTWYKTRYICFCFFFCFFDSLEKVTNTTTATAVFFLWGNTDWCPTSYKARKDSHGTVA